VQCKLNAFSDGRVATLGKPRDRKSSKLYQARRIQRVANRGDLREEHHGGGSQDSGENGDGGESGGGARGGESGLGCSAVHRVSRVGHHVPVGSAASVLRGDAFACDFVDVGVGHVHGVVDARGRVVPVSENQVVRVGGALGEGHGVPLGLVLLVREGVVPHSYAHVLGVGVDVGELLAAVRVLVLRVSRVAVFYIKVALRLVGTDGVVLAGVVPGVAVGSLDGHFGDLPSIVIRLRVRAVFMLAPLAQVLIALVEAGFLDKELLALGADSRAGVGLVAVAIQVTLDGDPLKRVKSRGGRVSFDGANKSAKKIGRSEVEKARCAREKRRVRHVDCGSGGGVLVRGQTADFACDEVGWERTKTEHNKKPDVFRRRSLKTPLPEPQ